MKRIAVSDDEKAVIVAGLRREAAMIAMKAIRSGTSKEGTARLRSLERTIAVYDAGKLGVCEGCDGDIPRTQLMDDPTAGVCKACRTVKAATPMAVAFA